jgi:RimJ/RimL family protein N-acetyltransferase
MTEAVEKFCKWALTDEKIETIIAETEIGNMASKRVLERCGLKKYKEEETAWWKLNKENKCIK